MKHLKNFIDKISDFRKPQAQPVEDIEGLSNVRSKVSEIFYILKDDNLGISIQYFKFREFKYIMIVISDGSKLLEDDVPTKESYEEFIDRLRESVSENGLKLSFLSISMDPFEKKCLRGTVIVGSRNAPDFSTAKDLAEASKKKEIEMYETF